MYAILERFGFDAFQAHMVGLAQANALASLEDDEVSPESVKPTEKSDLRPQESVKGTV